MIRTFCDRCDDPVTASRLTRVRVASATTPRDDHRHVGMRYDPADDETYSHELCGSCAEALRRWLTEAPARLAQRA